MMRRAKSGDQTGAGFTLIELLAAIAGIAIWAAMLLPALDANGESQESTQDYYTTFDDLEAVS